MADEGKFGEDAWGASLDALTLQLRALHELRKGLDPLYREGPHRGGDTADPQAGQMQKYLFGLAQLQLDHFRQVLEFSTKHFDYVMDQLRRGGRLGAPFLGMPPELTVYVTAPIGGQVRETFTIHNLRGRAAAMRFSTTDFTCDAGPARVAAPVSVEPVSDTYESVLEPHRAAEFRLSVPVDPARFTTPGHYQATTYVMDNDTVTGRVTIDLTVTAAPPRQSAAARARPAVRARRR